MVQTPRALLYGRDRTLVELRGKVLGTSGFKTKATDKRDEALELIQGGQFDLLILCQTLSDEECVEALEAAKGHAAMKRLVLTHGRRKLPRCMFDSECSPLEGPECLIQQAALLLDVAPKISPRTRRFEA